MPTDEAINFTVAGKKISLSKKAVESSVRRVAPDPIKKYWVEIGQFHYPIKQVISVAAGIPTPAFISTDAYRILTRLGFEVKS